MTPTTLRTKVLQDRTGRAHCRRLPSRAAIFSSVAQGAPDDARTPGCRRFVPQVFAILSQCREAAVRADTADAHTAVILKSRVWHEVWSRCRQIRRVACPCMQSRVMLTPSIRVRFKPYATNCVRHVQWPGAEVCVWSGETDRGRKWLFAREPGGWADCIGYTCPTETHVIYLSNHWPT